MTDDGTVVPFRRREQPPERPSDAALSRHVRGADPRARDLVAEQTAADRGRYLSALENQRFERERSPTPVPGRITIAMNLRALYGPDVDKACGTFEKNPAGDVDDWEAARAVPSAEQVKAIAALTDFPERFFYLPLEAGVRVIRACGPRGTATVITETVDDRGVLTLEFDDVGRRKRPPKPKPPKPAPPGQLPIEADGMPEPPPAPEPEPEPVRDPRAPHRFEQDKQTPGVCKWCPFPKTNRRHQ